MALDPFELRLLGEGAKGGSPDKWGSRRPNKGSAIVRSGNVSEAIEYLKAEAAKLGKVVIGIQRSESGGFTELRFDLRENRGGNSTPWTHKGRRNVPRGSSTGGGSLGIRGGFGDK